MTGWEKRFAVLQTIAHLQSLEYNQLLKHSVSDGQHYFQAVHP
jgi:hypothetical protein